MEIASAKEANLEIALLPLLHKEVRIRRIELQRPRISIKRDRDGVFNFEKRKEAKGTFFTLGLDNLSLTDGVFLYGDEQSGEGFEVGNFKLNSHSSRISGGNSAELLKNLSFTAEFACREIRTKDLMLSDVKFTCKGKDGIFALNPVTMRLFGGQGSGSIGADFSGPVPHYSIRASLSKFRIEEYLKTVSSKKVAEGSMDFSASLSMRGNTAKEIKQTAGGEVSLRGENLTLYGNDLDREFARFESSQNFNLLDAGALLFTGPLGLAVTKGYNFASIFQGSGGSSSIGKLFSDWKVERGIAQAKDVAMATKQNRIALKGRINFVDEQFDDVTIALIDAQGCAKVQQKIHGPFRKPVVEKPNVLMSFAGPAVNLLKRARDLFTGGKCEAFYTGSVPAPK
jgi:AsmA protein